ncbi:hypothetical protein ACTHAM_000600 [Cellulomonas soli]|uniref:hypothetical protein n=1 Tax=Cellulomonas soli TaxID=931535 RepID=UPI003F861058
MHPFVPLLRPGLLAATDDSAAGGLDWPGLAGLLRAALVLGVVWLCYDVLARLVARELLARRIVRADPSRARVVRMALRESMPLLRWRAKGFVYPSDPFALVTPVVVPPLGDGRPGEHFLAAGPSQVESQISVWGVRTDATVPVAPGVALLVVCLGRIGTVQAAENPGEPDYVLRDAAARMADIDLPSTVTRLRVGPVERGVTAAGEAWRHTFQVGSQLVTDTHLDHDGWAFVVGVLRPAGFQGAERIVDGVLSTWRWIPDGGITRQV